MPADLILTVTPMSCQPLSVREKVRVEFTVHTTTVLEAQEWIQAVARYAVAYGKLPEVPKG